MGPRDSDSAGERLEVLPKSRVVFRGLWSPVCFYLSSDFGRARGFGFELSGAEEGDWDQAGRRAWVVMLGAAVSKSSVS